MLGAAVLTQVVPAQAQPVQMPAIDYGAIAPVLIVLGAACL